MKIPTLSILLLVKVVGNWKRVTGSLTCLPFSRDSSGIEWLLPNWPAVVWRVWLSWFCAQPSFQLMFLSRSKVYFEGFLSYIIKRLEVGGIQLNKSSIQQIRTKQSNASHSNTAEYTHRRLVTVAVTDPKLQYVSLQCCCAFWAGSTWINEWTIEAIEAIEAITSDNQIWRGIPIDPQFHKAESWLLKKLIPAVAFAELPPQNDASDRNGCQIFMISMTVQKTASKTLFRNWWRGQSKGDTY